MKRLCIFYKYAGNYLGKPIDWIVCKECQKKLHYGTGWIEMVAYIKDYREIWRRSDRSTEQGTNKTT